MSTGEDFPVNNSMNDEIKPWEQRAAPGMGGGGGGERMADPRLEPPGPPRLVQTTFNDELPDLVNRQTDLAYYPMVDRHTTPGNDLSKSAGTNQDVWRLFIEEKLYDTKRVTLEHFHLFEWFPVAPGRFHTAAAQENRQSAMEMMVRTPEGHAYFNPLGKASMIRGGIGAVRLRPRLIGGEPHYFMTVSSNGVCHEGFPVLVPRRLYGPLKERLLTGGVVPVSLSGEMRYLYGDAPSFFESRREIPLLYLHVDHLEALPAPRADVSGFSVSVAVSFVGKFDNNEGIYSTYATFDPARPESLVKAANWLEQFYVTQTYKGVVVTDFDEQQPRFAGAVFGLPELMAGKLDPGKIGAFLKSHGFPEQSGQKFFVIYKENNVSLNIGRDVIDSNIIIGDNNTVTTLPNEKDGGVPKTVQPDHTDGS